MSGATMKVWQEQKSLGWCCMKHCNPRDGYMYDSRYCPRSEPYEKQECEFKDVVQVECLICCRPVKPVRKGSSKCPGHRVAARGKNVIAFVHEFWESWDGQEAYKSSLIAAFSTDGQKRRVWYRGGGDDWKTKMLAFIRKEGDKALKVRE